MLRQKKGATKPAVVKKPAPKAKPRAADKAEQGGLDQQAPPALLSEPIDGKADNLKEISGIGPVIERKLNAMGVYHFSQIASWDAENCAMLTTSWHSKAGLAEKTGLSSPIPSLMAVRPSSPNELQRARLDPAKAEETSNGHDA